jgi:hypothetical protein
LRRKNQVFLSLRCVIAEVETRVRGARGLGLETDVSDDGRVERLRGYVMKGGRAVQCGGHMHDRECLGV